MKLPMLGPLWMLAGLCSCTYNNEEDFFPLNYCDTASVGYVQTIRPIIETKCAVGGCHVPGGEGNGDFAVYAGLKDKVDDGLLLPAINQAPGAVAMPPYSKLTDCEIAKITMWVQQGAPAN